MNYMSTFLPSPSTRLGFSYLRIFHNELLQGRGRLLAEGVIRPKPRPGILPWSVGCLGGKAGPRKGQTKEDVGKMHLDTESDDAKV